MVKLISLKSQVLDDGPRIEVGERFEKCERTARWLVSRGRARYAEESEPDEAKKKPKPKPYNRRDMRAAS